MINQFIRQYGKRLYGLCLHLCINSFEADDLYQETWLKVVKNIEKYDPTKEFEPWLTQICVNTYRNSLRRIMRSPILDFSSNENKDAVFQSVAAPEKEDYSELYDAVNRLPNKLRLAVILFYFREQDIASVADILHIPVGTVKSRLNKARKILREVLSSETDLQF